MRCSRSAIASPFIAALALALSICAPPALSAQVTSGSINGTVKDTTGGVLPHASVTVSNPSSGVTRAVVTNDNGDFVVPNLPPGTYTIRVEVEGFKVLEKAGVALSATDRLNAGVFELTLGGTSEVVNVSAGGGELQLQANSGERSDLITGNQLNNLALNGRNILDFVKVVPGVVSSFDGQVAGTGGIESQRERHSANEHEFTIDGSSNVDRGNNGGTHVTLNPDAVAEMKILTSNYQAEFGKRRRAARRDHEKRLAQLPRQRSLLRQERGAEREQLVCESGRDREGRVSVHFFGYDIGGPVLIPKTGFNSNRDKLFFYWGQEYYRQRVPGGFDQFRVPTALERSGDFSQTVDGNGNPLVIYNPATGQPSPGNKIDRNALPPAQQAVFDQVSKIFNLYDLPNVSGNNQYNFSSQLSYDNPIREDILRLDYQVNGSNRLFGRWIHNMTEFESPMQNWNLTCMGRLQFPGGCIARAPSWNLALNLVTTISPTLVNEATFRPSVTRSDWRGNNGNISRATNGIDLPLLFPVTSDANIPDFGFTGNENIDYPWSYLGANPWFQANTTINFSDTLTKVFKNHTVKTGVFFQRARKDQIRGATSTARRASATARPPAIR